MHKLSDAPAEEAPVGVGRSAAAQIIAQQAAIAHIGQVALGHGSLDELFAEACSLVSRVLETELVSVLELAPDGGSLRVVAGVGWRPGVVGELVVGAATDSQSGYTLQTGGPVIVGDLTMETRFTVPPSLHEHHARSGMSVRIGGAKRPYGVVAVFTSRRGRFTRDDAHFLQAVANVLAAAIDRAKTEAELRTSRDQLAAMVATIDEGITVRDHQGLIFANDTAARLSGYRSADELIDASATVLDRYELFDAAGHALAAEQLPGRVALAGGDGTEAVVGFRGRETGGMRWSAVRANAVRDATGRVTHVITRSAT